MGVVDAPIVAEARRGLRAVILVAIVVACARQREDNFLASGRRSLLGRGRSRRGNCRRSCHDMSRHGAISRPLSSSINNNKSVNPVASERAQDFRL